MLNAFSAPLCSKLCWHNQLAPTNWEMLKCTCKNGVTHDSKHAYDECVGGVCAVFSPI